MKTSETYASKIAIATELAHLGCRAVTLTAAARTKPADSRHVYRKIRGEQSQSGQTPSDHEWFFVTKTRRMHAAFLLLTYAKYRAHHAGDPDAHGLAFTLALRMYHALTGQEAPISPERWNLLIGKGYDRNWRVIPQGGATSFLDDNGKVLRCRKCRVPHFVEAHYMNYTCPTCP